MSLLGALRILAATFITGWLFMGGPLSHAATPPEEIYRFATGASESSGVIEGPDGALYGVITRSKADNVGTIYRLLNGHLSTLHALPAADGPFSTRSLVLGDDGNIYGTTGPLGSVSRVAGQDLIGAGIGGTVFRLDPSSGEFSTVHRFHEGADGVTPRGPLISGSDGNLYGTTFNKSGALGAARQSFVFKLTLDGTATTLHTFQNDTDGSPNSLIQARDGFLYGTTAGDGNLRNAGMIFRLSLAGEFVVLHTFPRDQTSKGASPVGVTMTADNTLYGTTSGGGGPDFAALTNFSVNPFVGTVFKLASNGTLTTLHRFSISDGAMPLFGLIEGDDAYLYGTTSGGGAYGFGTVFRITTSGRLSSVHDMLLPGIFSPMSRGLNGMIYGVRSETMSQQSVVFRVSTRR